MISEMVFQELLFCGPKFLYWHEQKSQDHSGTLLPREESQYMLHDSHNESILSGQTKNTPQSECHLYLRRMGGGGGGG